MEENNVEVRFKKWLKILNYLGAGFCIIGYIFILGFLITGNNTNFLLVIGLLGAIAFSILWFINIYQFNINFGAISIEKSGAFDKQIPYEEIKKIKVNKDRIEIQGEGKLNFVAIGNLYTNFQAAKEKLASKIKGVENIEIEGKPRYIDKHLHAPPS